MLVVELTSLFLNNSFIHYLNVFITYKPQKTFEIIPRIKFPTTSLLRAHV